jgi:hypothetical protein
VPLGSRFATRLTFRHSAYACRPLTLAATTLNRDYPSLVTRSRLPPPLTLAARPPFDAVRRELTDFACRTQAAITSTWEPD